MKFTKLLLKNLWRNPRRTVLTVLSLAVALFVFCSMDTLVTTMKNLFLSESTTKARLLVRDKYGSPGMVQMPEAYEEKLRRVPHVVEVEAMNFFSAAMDEAASNHIQGNATDPDVEFRVFADQLEDIPESVRHEYRQKKNAMLAGENVLRSHGWKIGQTVRMKLIWPKPMEVEAVLVGTGNHPKFTNRALLHRDYLLDVVGQGGKVDMFWLLLDRPGSFAEVARTVDAMFENSEHETRTETESQFFTSFMGFMAGLFSLVQGISVMVLFAITFVAGNAIAMSVRERTVEIAVMKAIGFQSRLILMLVASEAVLGGAVGGMLGCLAAYGFFLLVPAKGMGFLSFSIAGETIVRGIGLSVLIGLLSGIIPAWRASRLHIVQTLRDVG